MPCESKCQKAVRAANIKALTLLPSPKQAISSLSLGQPHLLVVLNLCKPSILIRDSQGRSLVGAQKPPSLPWQGRTHRPGVPGPAAPCCSGLRGYRKVYSDQGSGLKDGDRRPKNLHRSGTKFRNAAGGAVGVLAGPAWAGQLSPSPHQGWRPVLLTPFPVGRGTQVQKFPRLPAALVAQLIYLMRKTSKAGHPRGRDSQRAQN